MAEDKYGGMEPNVFTDLAIRRRQINQRQSLGLRQQNYLKGVTQNESGRQFRDWAQEYGKVQGRLPYKFGARGLMNSGIYGKARYDTAQSFGNAYQDIHGRLQDQLHGFSEAKRQLKEVGAGGLADVESLEQTYKDMRPVREMIDAMG